MDIYHKRYVFHTARRLGKNTLRYIALFFRWSSNFLKGFTMEHTRLANTFGEMCINVSLMAVPNVKQSCILLSFSKERYREIFPKRVRFSC